MSSFSYGTTRDASCNTNNNVDEREAVLESDYETQTRKTKRTSSSFTNVLLNRKTLALGALAFVSVGALVVNKSSSSSSSFATLGTAKSDTLPHSFSELGKKASAPLGLRKKNSSTEKVGLLGAMDIHAWPDPFEEVQAVAQEEEPAVEEEAKKEEEEEVKQQPDYEEIQAAEQQIQQPVFAAQQQQPVAEAHVVQEEVPSQNVMETANPQWVNTNALAVQQQANNAAQVGASGIVTSAVAIDPQTGQPFATPADGGASLSQSLNTDLSKPPASWPVDMESGVQCNPIIGCVAHIRAQNFCRGNLPLMS